LIILLTFHFVKRLPKSCMELLHKKFFFDIIIALKNQPLAFNELQNQLKIYSDTLSRRLKELEENGVIEASVIQDENGKRVRYRRTGKGEKIAPLLIEAIKILEKAEELL
jgi:DNA-binding HxlR family transcriptional regulator